MSELALFGGPKTVTASNDDAFLPVSDVEIEAVVKEMRAGIVSIAGRSGVVKEFEDAFAAMCGTKYALVSNSGTNSIHAAMVALGVGPGTEVIVPSYTWHASITPILHCAATPVFCDICPDTLTPGAKEIEACITDKTVAIEIVHVWGNVAPMDEIMDLARKRGLKVLEDCSHAHGASLNGKSVGAWGDIGAFSCQGGKAVSGGELGVAVTEDPVLLDRMILTGWFGRVVAGDGARTFDHLGDMSLGVKYRPHPYAVAMANSRLKRLPCLNDCRRKNYRILNDTLRDAPHVRTIEPLPGAERGGFLEYKFILRDDLPKGVTRDRFCEAVKAEGAPLEPDRYSSFNYTYGLLHLAPMFNTFDLRQMGGCYYDFKRGDGSPKERYRPGSLPVTESICTRIVGLPGFVDVSEKYVCQVAQAIRKVAEHAEELAV
ncbi:MAG TPA: DegT/DnrJ/EryC1/StrS family aminotransferase [bacterium]|nr:DegT/DnrJ/EryC1/StrS family aminotransferase [bacterium]